MDSTRTSGATLSECGRYRYTLTRAIPFHQFGNLTWLCLNPSTADASTDDATVRKIRGFTERHGYGKFTIVNLFAWRARDPKELARNIEIAEGPENLNTIEAVARSSTRLVAAWGQTASRPFVAEQASKVVSRLATLWPGLKILCLGHNKDGSPRHPLMIPYSQPLIPYLRSETTDGD